MLVGTARRFQQRCGSHLFSQYKRLFISPPPPSCLKWPLVYSPVNLSSPIKYGGLQNHVANGWWIS